MKLVAKAYDIDDGDVEMIEEQVISAICEDLEVRLDISFSTLEKESQLALVAEVFEKLKKDIEEGIF